MSEILSKDDVAQTKVGAKMGNWDWSKEIQELCDSHEALRAENERLRALLTRMVEVAVCLHGWGEVRCAVNAHESLACPLLVYVASVEGQLKQHRAELETADEQAVQAGEKEGLPVVDEC